MVSTYGASEVCATVQYQRMPRRRHIRSDSRPPFSLWMEIAVRTPTDRRRLTHAQPSAIFVRKSLKRTAQQPRVPTSFSDLPFAGHQYGPGFGAETFFFTHRLEFVRHLDARRHASGSARQKRVRPKKARTSDYSFSLTNGLSQPRGRLLTSLCALTSSKGWARAPGYFVQDFRRRKLRCCRAGSLSRQRR